MTTKVLFKIIVAGDGGVGKTTLLKRFVDGTFDINTKMSIGVDLHQKYVTIGENFTCNLMIWDLGGQEQFRFLLDRFIDGASGALLMFDMTRVQTLYNLDEWIKLSRSQDPNLPCVLVGGKEDLMMDQFYAEDKAIQYMEENNLLDYIRTSSKTGDNINEAIEILVRGILKYKNIAF
ncbi:MAG: GTP-binding protein [Candidatus Lokiarchaeota archaeon]|nr:GTP-binding protein [Candidatus Lokiarchaeota archaeon]